MPHRRSDFDGDVLNILLITNDEFYKRACEVFNPRNVMYISRDDAKFNTDVCHQKDTIISAHTLMKLGRGQYTPQEWAAIQVVRERNKNRRSMV